MTPTELLKPRYEVIADYPGSELRIGTVLTPTPKDRKERKLLNKYPHLFRPLAWWEHRKPEDMPEYIWYKLLPDSKPRCLKVDEHFKDNNGNKNVLGCYVNEEIRV